MAMEEDEGRTALESDLDAYDPLSRPHRRRQQTSAAASADGSRQQPRRRRKQLRIPDCGDAGGGSGTISDNNTGDAPAHSRMAAEPEQPTPDDDDDERAEIEAAERAPAPPKTEQRLSASAEAVAAARADLARLAAELRTRQADAYSEDDLTAMYQSVRQITLQEGDAFAWERVAEHNRAHHVHDFELDERDEILENEDERMAMLSLADSLQQLTLRTAPRQRPTLLMLPLSVLETVFAHLPLASIAALACASRSAYVLAHTVPFHVTLAAPAAVEQTCRRYANARVFFAPPRTAGSGAYAPGTKRILTLLKTRTISLHGARLCLDRPELLLSRATMAALGQLAVLDLSGSLALEDVSQLARVHTLVLRDCPRIANLQLIQPHVQNLIL